jgi:hypothetical protein
MKNNFCDYILSRGGELRSLELPYEFSKGLGLCNPSIFIDGDDILVNVRRVNYALHTSADVYEWNSAYGPTNYHHPDHDVNLRTDNFMMRLDNDYNIIPESIKQIDYTKFNKKPIWGFVGEEDVRIVRWDGKLYVTGCRRDVKSNGESRMELSELDGDFKEISRTRVPALKADSYCEKNWMPILDMPYHYIKWSNPLDLVKYDPATNTTTRVLTKQYKIESKDPLCDLRGSSQVLKIDNYYIALVHECTLWHNRYNEREGDYFNRFIVWDEDWNVVKLSERFLYMDFEIEFGVGLAYKDGKFLIPFGVYDNVPYMLIATKESIFGFIGIGDEVAPQHYGGFGDTKIVTEYIADYKNPYAAYDVGMDYYKRRQYCCAHAFFLRAAQVSVCAFSNAKETYKKIGYDAFYMCQKCLERLGDRKDKMLGQYQQLIDWDSERFEAYYELSNLYYGYGENFNNHYIALGYAASAKSKRHTTVTNIPPNEYISEDRVLLQYYICNYRCSKDYVAVEGLRTLLRESTPHIKNLIRSLNLNLNV